MICNCEVSQSKAIVLCALLPLFYTFLHNSLMIMIQKRTKTWI